MSLVEHLEELRWRIFKSLGAIVVGAIVAFIFRDQIMNFLQAPLPDQANILHNLGGQGGHKLVTSGLTEGLTVELILSAVVGFIITLPVILYQAWAFIVPGLYRHEKRNAVPFIFIGIVLFAVGISLGYVVLRFPVEWLIAFQSASFTQLVTADSYFKFVAIFMLTASPLSPTCVTLRAMSSSSGFTRSNVSLRPPTIMVNLPSTSVTTLPVLLFLVSQCLACMS